jgi:hypothetical protein
MLVTLLSKTSMDMPSLLTVVVTWNLMDSFCVSINRNSGGTMVAFELDIRVSMHISVMMYATGRALVFMSDLK